MTTFGGSLNQTSGVSSVVRTFTPAELRAGVDIQILPAAAGVLYFVLGVIFELQALTVQWNAGQISIFSGHGDLFWSQSGANFALQPAGQSINNGVAFSNSGGTPARGEAIFATFVGFGPAGADGPVKMTLLYQSL